MEVVQDSSITSPATASPPAPDGGWGWIVLAASVMNMILTAGFMEGMGVLYVEWQEYFSIGPPEVGWVGIIGATVGPIGCLIAGGLTSRFGHRPVVTVSGVLHCVLMFAASFTSELWHIYLVFGIHALALGAAYQPSITVIGSYFQKWLALANGITFSGVGIGIIVIPIILEALSAQYTWKGALRGLSAISVLLPICGLLFKPSTKELYLLRQHKTHRNSRESSRGSILNFLGVDMLAQNHRFLVLTASMFVMGYGYYGSLVFIASKAVYEVGLSKLQGALLISLIGVGSTISRASHGFLIDLGLVTPITLYTLGCFINAATDFLNPFARSFSTLAVLAVSFGLSSGLVFAVSIMCVRSVLQENQISRGFGVIMLCNGLGTVIGIFAMAYLEEATGSYSVPFVLAGFAMVLSGILMATVSVCSRCCARDPQPSRFSTEERHHIDEVKGGSCDDVDDIPTTERHALTNENYQPVDV